jgi:hypothetical protein
MFPEAPLKQDRVSVKRILNNMSIGGPYSYSTKLGSKGVTYSWSSALLEKPPVVQLIKNFPAFYVFTRALHWSLS